MEALDPTLRTRCSRKGQLRGHTDLGRGIDAATSDLQGESRRSVSIDMDRAAETRQIHLDGGKLAFRCSINLRFSRYLFSCELIERLQKMHVFVRLRGLSTRKKSDSARA